MSGQGIGHFITASASLLFLLSSSLLAQETVPAQESTTGQAATKPAERIIYLPYEKLEDVLDQQSSSVIIPYPEYIRLWSKAENADGAAGSKVDAVISHASYSAIVEEDVAHIRADLTVRVVGKPWVEVPLSFGDAAVGSVTSETGNVLLRGTGDGKYSLLLKEPGDQRVTLELTTRVVTSPDGREIHFETPTVAVTTLELTVPQADQEVEVRPQLVQSVMVHDAGTTRVKASLGATGNITARWHARASAKPQMELLASVTNLQKVSVADGLIHADATLDYSILRGELEQVRLVVPKDHRVLDVTASARIQKWQAIDDGNRQVVTVDLLASATDQLTVEVHTEAKLADGDFAIAGIDDSGQANGIHALDVIRESGQLVVAHGEDLTLRVTEQSGLVRIEAEEVAEAIRQTGALAYKFFSSQFFLRVATSPVQPRVTVDHVARVEIREDQVLLDAGVTYAIERAGVFELRLSVPDGLEITRVESEQLDEFRMDGDTLVISLRQRMTGTVAVSLTGESALPSDGEQFDLPLLQPMSVERERGTVRLFARDAVEVTTNEEELESALPDALGAAQRQAGSGLRASWRFTRRPVRIPVTVTRKPTRLSAQVASDVDVQPTRTRITTNVDFLVEYAGLDTFRIDVPEAAMPTLQIEAVASEPTSPALRETTTGDPIDGWVTHTLTMQRPVTGRQRFRLTYDLQPSELEPQATEVEQDGNAAARGGTGDAAAATDDGAAAATDAAAAGKAEDASPPADEVPATRDAPDPTNAAGDVEPTPAPGVGTVDAEPPVAAEPVAQDQSPTSESETAETADESPGETEPNVPRFQTEIWIIRPLGIDAEGDGEATELSLVTGEVRLRNEESLTITALAAGSDIEPIDVRELQSLPQQGTLAFRYRKHSVDETITLTVTQARYDVREMLATVVSRALVEIMLGDDPTATYRCRFRIKSTERQRLELRLPNGVDLLSVLVNDREVRLEPIDLESDQTWDRYYVNVSRSGESDEAFHLSLQFLLSLNEPPFESGLLEGSLPALRGRPSLQLPVVGTEDGSAATLELRTVIWVPEEYALIGDPSGFTLTGYPPITSTLSGAAQRSGSTDDDSWIGHSPAGGLDFPTSGRVAYRYTNLGGQGVIKPLWWDSLWVTIVVSCTLAAIAVVLVRTDWENKLGILLLIAFGAVLLGLRSLHTLAHAVSAMQFGLAFMIGLWVIHALVSHRPTAATASAETDVTTATPPHAAAVPPPGVFDHFLSPKSDSDESLQ